MMGTELSELHAENTNQLGNNATNNIQIIKHELETEAENGAQTSNNLNPFEGSELDGIIKVKNYKSERFVANIIAKTELDEYYGNISTTEISNPNPNHLQTVMLEIIPKTETSILGNESCGPSFDENEDVMRNIDPYSDCGFSSDPDPERDPFGDIHCDQSFPQKSQSDDPYGSTTTQGNQAQANQNLNLASSTENILPIANNSSKNHPQPKTLASCLQCQLCLEVQGSKRKLEAHVKICVMSHKHRNRFCVPCNKLFCRPLKYRFHARKIHEMKHLDRRPFKCSLCPKSCAHKETLIAHLALHQERNTVKETADDLKRKPFKCPKQNCEKVFGMYSHLQDHLQSVHSEEKPFKCQEPNCGKKFKLRGQLRKHMVCHSDKTPFQCSHLNCNKTFKSKERLMKHSAVHTGARSYRHITDRPFKCGECHRAFCKNWQLTQHLKTHLNQIFDCPEPDCGSTFKYKQNLGIHIANIHTNKNSLPFQCPEPNCEATFKYKNCLRAHLSYMHTTKKDSASPF